MAAPQAEPPRPVVPLALARSAVDVACDRVLHELFADSPASVGHPVPSTFALLSPRLRACSSARRDHAALAPSPELGRCLTQLVELLRFDRFDRVAARPSDRAHAGDRARRQRQFDLELAEQLLARIRRDASLSEQARVIRRSAGLAETAMEDHYSRLLVDALAARSRSGAAALLRASGLSRTRALLAYLAPFPYGLSYLRLVSAELRLLAAPAKPRLLRDRDLVGLPTDTRRDVGALRAELARLARVARLPLSLQASRARTIAVCGCGPLPVTGLMLHAASDVDVVLIDRDATSTTQAARLVDALERLGVLRPHAVRVRHGDVATLRFVPSNSDAAREPESVGCDVVLVASLVEQAAKTELARRLCADVRSAPLAVLMRSAASLCAELAYDPVETAQVSTLGLPFCGESVPRNLVFSQLDAHSAALRGVTCDQTSELLVTAHGSVLNTTELYHRVPLPAALAVVRVVSNPGRALSALRTQEEVS